MNSQKLHKATEDITTSAWHDNSPLQSYVNILLDFTKVAKNGQV